MGFVVFRYTRPSFGNRKKGGVGTAGTSMQRYSPAAQGERGSQRCAKLRKLS